MTHISNRLFHGTALNTGNPRSHFQSFSIMTVKEIKDYEGGTIFELVKSAEDYFNQDDMIDEPFYSVYGSFKADHARSGMTISTLTTLEEAIRLVETLSGNPVQEQKP